MELRVNEVAIPEKIDFNYEELKAELTSKALRICTHTRMPKI